MQYLLFPKKRNGKEKSSQMKDGACMLIIKLDAVDINHGK
jgi:hypothetical protein